MEYYVTVKMKCMLLSTWMNLRKNADGENASQKNTDSKILFS